MKDLNWPGAKNLPTTPSDLSKRTSSKDDFLNLDGDSCLNRQHVAGPPCPPFSDRELEDGVFMRRYEGQDGWMGIMGKRIPGGGNQRWFPRLRQLRYSAIGDPLFQAVRQQLRAQTEPQVIAGRPATDDSDVPAHSRWEPGTSSRTLANQPTPPAEAARSPE